MTAVAKEAGERLAIVIGVVVKNYISFIISDGLKPKIDAVLTKLLEDAKEAATPADEKDSKKEEKETIDSFVFTSPGVEEPAQFKIVIDDYPHKWPSYQNAYVAYDTHCVRIDKVKSGLLTLAMNYTIRFRQWDNLIDKLKAENKDYKLPQLPEEHLLGTYCCCLNRSWNPNHRNEMDAWLKGVQKEVGSGSKALASHFFMGDDWENQQITKTIFDKAYAASARELGVNAWGDLPPFDEGEAVTMLCQNVLVKEFLPKALQAVPANAPCRWRLEWTAAGTLYALTGAAMNAAWTPAQAAIDEVKKGIMKIIDDGGQDLVDKLAPLLTKIFEIVQSKMPKGDDDKAEEEKDEKGKVGSVVKDWSFQKTEIGGKFHGELADKEHGRHAVTNLKNGWEKALTDALGAQMDAAVQGSCSPKFARSGIVQLIVKEFAKYITGTFKEFTTVTPLINASRNLDQKRWDLEDELVKHKDDKAAFEKTINEASAVMWTQLPDAGLSLFKDLLDIKRKLFSYYNVLPHDAKLALAEVSTHMFQIQMRALNHLRADFTNKLKAKFADPANAASEDAVRAAVRGLWRDIIFDLISVIVTEGWVKTAEGLIDVAVANTLAYFFEKVWPIVVEPLKALAGLMPGPLQKLDVVALAETVVEKIITKGVVYCFTKIFFKLESAIFKQ